MSTASVRKLIFSAMFGALVFTATWISIPSPFGGNVNLGDSMLLLGAWMLGGPWSVIACSFGAALTDLLGAYSIYAPATLIIKALMVLSVLLAERLLHRAPTLLRALISAISAELIMTLGYFLYEGTFLYGFPSALLNVPMNLIQGTASILTAIILRQLLSHARLPRELR